MLNYIIGSDSCTVYVDGNSYTVNKQAKTYEMLIAAIRSNDLEAVRKAVDVRKAVASSFNAYSNKVRIEDGQVFFEDREITGLISSRIFDMIKLNLDVKPMVLFIENLMQNPSKRAVDELYGFIEACSLPITEDGHFLAYKRIRDDYLDCHSATMDNSVGRILQMPRNMVEEDKDKTCSYGLHFCSYDYLKHFGGARIVVVKINPADVVSIPSDYNNSKGRTCRYEVVDEIPLNEYNLPSYTLDENFTDQYGEGDPDEFMEEEKFDDDTLEVTPDVILGSSGMTLNTLRSIRACLAAGETYAKIAAFHEISPRQVGRIDRGEAWANVQ